MRLQLKKFDMSSIAADKVVVMIGKRDTGKSFLCKDLLWHQRKIPVGTVISATEAANCFYGDMVPPIFIHNEYSEDIIQRILMRQEKLLHKKKQPGGFNINPSAFLILDDCLYDNSWTKSKHVRSLFMNGRHFKMFFIITMQYALGIPPNLRTNIDYVFILRENIVQNRKRLYDCYAGMFPCFEVFCAVMDQCTENYECLVINNNAKTNKLQEQIYWYKADTHGNFKLGSKEFWELSKGLGSDDEAEQYDPSSQKKRGPSINVKKSKW